MILISYSGNTDELKNIIKYAKLNKTLLIGIVSNKKSNYIIKINEELDHIICYIYYNNDIGKEYWSESSVNTQIKLQAVVGAILMEKGLPYSLDFFVNLENK